MNITSVLRNVLDIDFAAHKISVRSTSGAILLFDFAAAFPSMSHDFMWDVLSTIGLPDHYIDMLKLFYKGNKHFIRMGGAVLDSITVYSGVRQGCPLSPLLFALCADILLRALAGHLHGDEALCAFADDTAVVVANWIRCIPALSKLFDEFRRISALALNIQKTVFIPLWKVSSVEELRFRITEVCPLWHSINLDNAGKYLGFMIGPGSHGRSWQKPLLKFISRARDWASLRLGLFFNIRVYRMFILSVVSFVMQLEPDMPDL